MTKGELRQIIREALREEIEMQRSEDHYTVTFNDARQQPLFTGTKAECDDFVKKIKDSPATVAHGGVKVSKGADVPVRKK